MSGARILIGVLLVAALLLWGALAGGSDADLDRGLDATDDAFEHVERALKELDPDYQALRAQGLVLGLREQHDDLRNKLAALKTRRVELANDPAVDRRERLPQFEAIVEESDVLLDLAVQLHRECRALVEFRKEVGPLLVDAARQRAELAARSEADPDRRARIATAAETLREAEDSAAMAERLMHGNVDHGRQFGQGTLSKLRSVIAEQARLLER
jgi:hypothetical protein